MTVDTLDGLSARVGLDRLNFMKVDVEGAELQVLYGGKDVIDSFRPTMLLEIEARHTERFSCSPDDVVDWLSERGYLMYTWQRGWKRTDRVTTRPATTCSGPVAGRSVPRPGHAGSRQTRPPGTILARRSLGRHGGKHY